MEDKVYLPPNYDSDDDDDIELLDENEGEFETFLDNNIKTEKEEIEEEKPMTTPFSNPPQQNTTPRWGSGNLTSNPISTPWSSPQPMNNSTGMWGSSNGVWKPPQTSTWGQNNATKETINRSKKVIFIDFLDGIVETYQSNQVPGYLPRDIFDLTPRFDVWQKISAFNPERVYIMVPKNLLPSTNGAEGWQAALTYYCCSLSSYLRVPYTNCQILVGSVIGQSKASLMASVIDDKSRPINKQDVVSIGFRSGLQGQPDIDLVAANECGIDYIDLYNLLNNMI